MMGFPNYIVDEQINVWLKMLSNKINTVPLHPVNIYHIFSPQPNALQLLIRWKHIKNIDSKKHTLPTDPRAPRVA